MSTSYSADLIVGFPLSEVLKKEEYTEEVTKYDEDTGKPYTKEITKVRYLFNGEEVDTSKYLNTYTGSFVPSFLITDKLELNIFNEGYTRYTDDDYYKKSVVGERIKSTEKCSTVDLSKIHAKLLKVSNKLMNAHISNIDIKIYLILDSY